MAAEENAKAQLVQKEAEAKANQLLVDAGLSPDAAAKYRMDTAIGVADKLSQTQFPSTMIIGGSNGGAAMSPIEVIGINQMMDLANRMSKEAGKEQEDSQ